MNEVFKSICKTLTSQLQEYYAGKLKGSKAYIMKLEHLSFKATYYGQNKRTVRAGGFV